MPSIYGSQNIDKNWSAREILVLNAPATSERLNEPA